MTDPNHSDGLARKMFLAEAAAVREHLAEQQQASTDRAEALLAPLEAKVRELEAQRRAERRAAIARVRALHRKATHGEDCVHCAAFGPAYDNTWPCQTIRVLDGTAPIPPTPAATEATEPIVDRPFRSHRPKPAPAEHLGNGANAEDCPGYETVPNRCACPCEGCKHHCAAHTAAGARQDGAQT